MNKQKTLVLIAVLGALIACGQAVAHDPPPSISQPGPDLPPDGVYLSPNDVHARYTAGALDIVLTAVQHQPFADLSPTDYPPQCGGTAGVPGGPCEHHHFESGLDAMVSINGGPATAEPPRVKRELSRRK
jgi:hypothetical protein